MTISTALKTTLATAILFAATACNTVQGLGEDISSVGKKGEEVIND